MMKRRYNSKEDIKKALYEKWGDQYTLIEDKNQHNFRMHDKVNIKCNKCGNISSKEINTILKFRCKYCCNKDIRHFRNNEEMKKYVSNITNNEYTLLSNHSKTRDIAIFRHNSEKCKNKIFKMKIHNFITNNHRCPYCQPILNNRNKSYGNEMIETYLKNKNVKYYREYGFDKCRSKRGRLLRFDFYLPELNIAIEYDGLQHEKPIQYFGGEKIYEQTKYNDKVKTLYCLNNHIKLIRIKYISRIDINKITKTLDNALYNNVQRTSKA